MKPIKTKNIFTVLALFSLAAMGCNPLRAPDVPAIKDTSPVDLSELRYDCSAGEIGPEMERGATRLPIAKNLNPKKKWVYWVAGHPCAVEAVDDGFISSPAWDFRVTRVVPLIGTNGGAMAEDYETKGAAEIAVWPASNGADPLNAPWPGSVSDVIGLPFQADAYEGLKYGGMVLSPEYQSALLNTFEIGIANKYFPNHSIELSYRIFILKAADGLRYYALRFTSYSAAGDYLDFEWRKL